MQEARGPMPAKKKSVNLLVSLFPLPVTLVSCATAKGKANVTAASFVGVAALRPRILSLSLLHSSYSCRIILATGKFGLNVPDGSLLWQVDQAGMISGRERKNKVADLGLTLFPGPQTGVPLVQECPLNVECVVRERLSFTTSETFLGEAVNVLADEHLIDDARGRIDFGKLELFVFNQGEYWSLFERIGRYGFSRQRASDGGKPPETD